MQSARPISDRQTTAVQSADAESEERQAYLEEAHLESTQYGVGRYDYLGESTTE